MTSTTTTLNLALGARLNQFLVKVEGHYRYKFAPRIHHFLPDKTLTN
jgi:hypothetical protein